MSNNKNLAPRITSNKRQRRFSHAKCSLWISSTRPISSSDKMPVTSWIKVSAEALGLRTQHPTWCTSQTLEDYNPIPSSYAIFYIYLHLVDFLMVNVGKHTIHWWYGIAYRAYSSDFHPRYILWPSQVGIFSIGQLLTMHLKNPLPSFFRHVDTIKEPGLHIDAQISSQNIVPGIGQQVHPNTFARCKNKFYGFTAVVNLPPPHQTCHPTHTNEALLRVNHCFTLERHYSKPLFLGSYVRG